MLIKAYDSIFLVILRAYTSYKILIFNNNKLFMIIIKRKDGETIDRALRRYKRKHREVKLMKELRRRKNYVKPSVERRKEIIKAVYSLKKLLPL